MSSDYGLAKATHLHYVGEEPPKNPRRRRHQGTLILPCSGHVRPAGHATCNVAILTNTTLGNRYLGPRIDEEHSKMRYLVWIAESREPSSFWTQVAPEAFWLRAHLFGRYAKDTPNQYLGMDVVFRSPCLVAWWVEVGAAGIPTLRSNSTSKLTLQPTFTCVCGRYRCRYRYH